MDTLEEYLGRVKAGMDMGTDVEREAVIAQMRTQIEERAARLEAKGLPREKAVRRAIWRNSPWLCVPALIGYFLCFALPSLLLSLLFPSHMPTIAGAAVVLLPLVSGFIVGIWSTDPAWPRDVRRWAVLLIVEISLIMTIVDGAMEVARIGQWTPLLVRGLIVLAMLALVFTGFFPGRVLGKQRAGQARSASEEGSTDESA